MDHLSGPGSSPSHGAFLVTCALGGGKSKGQKNLNLNLVAAITICSDFGAPEIKSDTVSTVSPSTSHGYSLGSMTLNP